MDKLNRLMTDPNFDCRLVIQLNFADLLNATLYARNKSFTANKWTVTAEGKTLTDVLESLNAAIED